MRFLVLRQGFNIIYLGKLAIKDSKIIIGVEGIF
ncbi:Uncharacterised protein [Yersinia enterocolitica]|uniref:Uncharacterized protein n=1 Tax=Yersinia enterocolitica TaxID=630 RepID=A0A9P1PW72_YEREN|nr:Uncharacterised protein [Yersinia enterocolitica]CFQ80799.1 Uncharacterised protein [Yersinia enterocolitica]CNC12666.1 Uncharacterised protein [Yersinia enterocolitica]CNE98378.1 Uncharacterised protein [Yersinia enterocolitica]CNF40980.1 Uncharacterised protein [Yersinia enterocolitica]